MGIVFLLLFCFFSYLLFYLNLRLLSTPTEELSADLKEKAVGVRTFPTGFEALVKAEDTGAFSSLSIEPATIDEIVVFTSKKGDDYE